MGDFGEFDDFQCEVQGRPIKIFKNGEFSNSKVLFVQNHWSWDEFLCAVTQRLEMMPKASRVFNADGVEIDDIMCIDDNAMLFFSTSEGFQAPQNDTSEENSEPFESTSNDFDGVVGGYRVGSFLGRGGFGEVRLGCHQLTNEQMALKFILKSEMGSLGDVERTTTEIQCLTALNHPGIIKLLRVFNEPQHLVLGIELLEGGDLHHFLRDQPVEMRLTESECRMIFTQVVAGVGYAHNQHICHRDLKLENILLAGKNDVSCVKIADFGLSDFYRPGAMVKTSCGSISYLAPEVFRGTSNAGPPLDVWSLGVILFAIFCRRLPFEGDDLHGTNRPRESVIRSRILRCQYKLDDNVSAEAIDLLECLLKLDPSERFTIPEIFNHAWLRGSSSTAGSTELKSNMSVAKTEKLKQPSLQVTVLEEVSTLSNPDQIVNTQNSMKEKELPSAAQRSPLNYQASARNTVAVTNPHRAMRGRRVSEEQNVNQIASQNSTLPPSPNRRNSIRGSQRSLAGSPKRNSKDGMKTDSHRRSVVSSDEKALASKARRRTNCEEEDSSCKVSRG